MKRVIFIVIGVLAIVLLKSNMRPRLPQDTVSNTMVQYQGKSYRAIMAHHGDTLERVVLIESSQDPYIVLTRDSTGCYDVSYATATGPRHDSMDAEVAVLDRHQGLQRVNYSGTLEELGRRIQEKQPLDVSLSH